MFAGGGKCALCNCDSLLCLRSSSMTLNCRWHSKHWNEIGSPCTNSGSSKAATGTGVTAAGEAPAEDVLAAALEGEARFCFCCCCCWGCRKGSARAAARGGVNLGSQSKDMNGARARYCLNRRSRSGRCRLARCGGSGRYCWRRSGCRVGRAELFRFLVPLGEVRRRFAADDQIALLLFSCSTSCITSAGRKDRQRMVGTHRRAEQPWREEEQAPRRKLLQQAEEQSTWSSSDQT